MPIQACKSNINNMRRTSSFHKTVSLNWYLNGFYFSTVYHNLTFRRIFKYKEIEELTEKIMKMVSHIFTYMYMCIVIFFFQIKPHNKANRSLYANNNICKLYAKFHSRNVNVDHIFATVYPSYIVPFEQYIV